MSLFGKVLKSALQIHQSIKASHDPIKAQEEQLLSLLNTAAATSFGKYYNFEGILRSDDIRKAYRERVPIFEYGPMHQRWWQQQQLYPDITWPGHPDFFALSSGTTGNTSKRIPVTREMLQSIRSVSMSQLSSLANFDLPAEVFEKEILALGSSTNLKARQGHQEGEISGINASQAPFWFQYFYRPGENIARIDDWDERIAAIAEEAPNWDIGVIIGIPPWVKLMLERIIERHQLENIHELWPDLELYVTGGVAFGPYQKQFERLLDHPLLYQDTYLASEGYFAYNARPDTRAMQLAYRHDLYFEFIPFDERGFDGKGTILENPTTHHLGEVEEDQEYALLVSTPAGSWRYMIGDTIKFTNVDRFELVITGRTKYFMNVVGSQLSEEKLNEAVQEMERELDVTIDEFVLAAMANPSGQYRHHWILAGPTAPPQKEAAQALDQILKKKNPNYTGARGKALEEVQVTATYSEKLYKWVEATKKKGGQAKIPKVMGEDEMLDLLEFLEG